MHSVFLFSDKLLEAIDPGCTSHLCLPRGRIVFLPSAEQTGFTTLRRLRKIHLGPAGAFERKPMVLKL